MILLALIALLVLGIAGLVSSHAGSPNKHSTLSTKGLAAMKYVVVTASTVGDLEKLVNEQIARREVATR